MAAKLPGKAGKLNLVIEQGATFSVPMVWKDSTGNEIDNTGFDARMDIKQSIDDTVPLITLNVTNGGIILGGADGKITMFISDTDTAALTFSKAVYDLEMIDTLGKVIRLIEGSVTLSDEVTTSS